MRVCECVLLGEGHTGNGIPILTSVLIVRFLVKLNSVKRSKNGAIRVRKNLSQEGLQKDVMNSNSVADLFPSDLDFCLNFLH